MNTIYPLAGVVSSDPLQGGYAYLQWTGSVFHPGADLNTPGGAFTDQGAAVECPAAGVVAFRGFWDGVTRGEGNHIWIAHDNGDYTHHDHLQTAPAPEGTRLSRGSVFATCGNTGGWPYPHLHFEVWRGSVWGPPPSWTFWPAGRSLEWVQAHYADPDVWLRQAQDAADRAAGGAILTPIEGAPNVDQFNDAQLAAAARLLWRRAPFDESLAISAAWLAELKAGRYRGVPTGPEKDAGERVIVQRFTKRAAGDVIAVYADGVAAFAE